MPAEMQDSLVAAALGSTLVLLLSWLLARAESPTSRIFSRWLRWIAVASLLASSALYFDWAAAPWWVLAVVCFLAWFLLESSYTWIAVGALSRGSAPLFPQFRPRPDGDAWPTQRRFLALREAIRSHGFRKVQALEAHMLGDLSVRLTAFETPDATTRLLVVFIPLGPHQISACLSFQSQVQGGERLVTDNTFTAFGGFFPDHWLVERRPLCRGFSRLWERHRARVDAHGQPLVPFDVEPHLQINQDQQDLERLNRRLGFLAEHHDEGQSRITSAGRFRLWQEIWLLSYLGKPLRG